MEKRHHHGFTLIFSLIIAFGLISFALCFASEFKKSKKEDLRLDGKMCYLAGSEAFGLGIGALMCLFIAHFIGNIIICRNCCSRMSSCKAKKPTIATIFLSLSWVSFGSAVIVIGGATSMNQRQVVGEGWMDGECYIVKDGVYIGSSMLVLITLTSTLISGIISIRKSQVEQGQKRGKIRVRKDELLRTTWWRGDMKGERQVYKSQSTSPTEEEGHLDL